MDEIYVLCILILLPDIWAVMAKNIIGVLLFDRCKCGKCQTGLLCAARDYRCCQEFRQAIGRLGFEGLNVQCITDHNDYDAMTNQTVLFNVGPLIKDANGKRYRRPPLGQAANECVVKLLVAKLRFYSLIKSI